MARHPPERRRADGSKRVRSDAEEFVNAVTHGIGAVLAVSGLFVLLAFAVARGSLLDLVAAIVYGASLVFVFVASTAHHGLRSARAKATAEMLDEASIYLLIAGTYTPIMLIAVGGWLGLSILLVVWTLAVAGVVLRLLHRTHTARHALPLYLVMGWLGAVAFGSVHDALGPMLFAWLVAGGVLYTVGVAFFVWRSLPFGHAVWHVLVLAGSACHFAVVLGLVMSTSI